MLNLQIGELPEGILTVEVSGDADQFGERTVRFNVDSGADYLLVAATSGATGEALENVHFSLSGPDHSFDGDSLQEADGEEVTAKRGEHGTVLLILSGPEEGQWKLSVITKGSTTFSVTACVVTRSAPSNLENARKTILAKERSSPSFISRHKCSTCKIAMKGIANALVAAGVFGAASVALPAALCAILASILGPMISEFLKTVAKESLQGITERLCQFGNICPKSAS